MAANLTTRELRRMLTVPTGIAGREFDLLQQISLLINDEETEPTGREMLLRSLEFRDEFGGLQPVLDALARATGLFPYADADNLDYRDHLAYEFHRPLDMGDDVVFHREQAEVYRRLLNGENLILSAPTSFGKSRIIDAMIALKKYRNVAIIVPTLALIDETRRRLARFGDDYKVITHLSQEPAARNLFVFTAERAINYDRLPKIDFFVIDEFYKIGALDEDRTRTVALNQAFYKLRKGGGQFYLLGPSIREIPQGIERAFRCYFYPTEFATVVTEVERVNVGTDEVATLIELVKRLEGPTLIYCRSPARVNSLAHDFVAARVGRINPRMSPASQWARENFHPQWVFADALTRGIGMHHGKLPRSLSQYVVRAFNNDDLTVLLCTSTLIEGVNTKAKNVVIFDHEIGNQQPLDHFTFNNIKGRSGRMFKHFVGRVYLFHEPPQPLLPIVDFPLYTQDARTPDSLLVQMDKPDLRPPALIRVEKIEVDATLPMSVITENATIDPTAQSAAADAIRRDFGRLYPLLAWTRFPRWEQLLAVCNLIWDHFVDPSNRRSGVFSGSQLAVLTFQLGRDNTVRGRVNTALGKKDKYTPKTPDEAVERILQFDRKWAGFDLPRYMMAVSRIQAFVCGERGRRPGNYSFYAERVENLFRSSIVVSLDEYGVPIQVGEKIAGYLGTSDDLDVALANLKRLDPSRIPTLTQFEQEMVRFAQEGL